jgi:maltodextrin utilization protein YvdJ
MPRAQAGFVKIISLMVTGIVISAVLDAFSEQLGSFVVLLRIILNLIAIASFFESFHNMNYWGISYAVGYLVGILIFGNYFLEWWEIIIYVLMLTYYLFLKTGRKISRYYYYR